MDSFADAVLGPVAWAAGGAGLFFFWVSGIGLARMPDFFTRMHAGTKATTLGLVLVLVGVAFMEPQWTPKLLILGIFTLLTNPLGASVLARAAYRSGTDTVPMAHDALAGPRLDGAKPSEQQGAGDPASGRDRGEPISGGGSRP